MIDMNLPFNPFLKLQGSLEDCLLHAERALQTLFTSVGISEDLQNHIMVALNEAITNAIEHAHNFDTQKAVDVLFANEGDAIVFKVKDQGPGFAPERLPDPLDPGRLEEERGRGVFLMKSLADELEFHEGGTAVYLKFIQKRRQHA
jgi:serine/threonine-protein kinase RsbW